ncbi:hypothetical protein I552_8555 [Mycobacterium xenopi 3993]|nr:hypothetical protein I552_8555 [Mycobacterium xenopi 3993]
MQWRGRNSSSGASATPDADLMLWRIVVVLLEHAQLLETKCGAVVVKLVLQRNSLASKALGVVTHHVTMSFVQRWRRPTQM